MLMAVVREAAGQVQLGDDDERESRRAAVISDMECVAPHDGGRN